MYIDTQTDQQPQLSDAILIICIIFNCQRMESRGLSFVLYLTVREWKAEDCGILKPVKDTSMLPSEIDQMKVSQLRRQEVKLLDLDVP